MRRLYGLVLALTLAWSMPARTGEAIVVDSFVLNASTGDQSVTWASASGTPKAIVLFHSGQNTTDAVTDIGMAVVGWTDCTDDAHRGHRNNDGGLANTGGVYTQSDNDLLRFPSTTGTATVEANFVSCDANGFTINIGTTDGTQFRVNYVALLGSGIQAKIGTFTKPNATGSQVVTPAGLSFTPTLVFFMCGRDGQAGADAGGTAPSNISFSGTNGTQQWALAHGAISNSSGGMARTDDAIVCVDGSALDDQAAITTLDAAGWTLNWTTIDSTVEEPVFYLALRGVTSFFGTENQRTSNGTTALTGFGFQPQALLSVSRALVSGTTWAANGRFVMSAGDGMTQGGLFSGAAHGCGAGCATARAFFTNDFQRYYTPAATGSSSTLLAAMDLTTLDADGATVTWTTTDATAREYLYVGLKVESAGGGLLWFHNPILVCCGGH